MRTTTTSFFTILLTTTTTAFVCPSPVIPLPLGPSNACCETLTLIPGAEYVDAGIGEVYWGTSCSKATVNTTISSTQEDSNPCASGLSQGCCDPTFRDLLGSGPCTLPSS
ncbi:hypothetical protein MNV49_001729 [Pseudohyphozyma bogoriensis]|nr:hypothetical protein MNV49_001729 [Pseudohyphozyma bogoriensis]